MVAGAEVTQVTEESGTGKVVEKGLPRERRIRLQRDFEAIRKGGWKRECGAFRLMARVREGDDFRGPRVAVVASRRGVGNAVARNRAKRRMRALFRGAQEVLPAHLDLIMVARRPVLEKRYADLLGDLGVALEKLRRWECGRRQGV